MPEVQRVRHRFIDRLFHWSFALTAVALLATGLLPPFGVRFDWVPLHWTAGCLFLLLLAFHLLRSLAPARLRRMGIGRADLSGRPGKYSLAQKLMHHFVALACLTAGVSGALMLARIDTPLWERDPYWLGDTAWGWIYVLHGLSALLLLSALMLHVYFALRPEKAAYLRAMVLGWMREDEYRRLHDPARWQPEVKPEKAAKGQKGAGFQPRREGQ